MELYFLRHGVAVSRGEWEGAEADRPLTESGKEEVARLAAFLAKLGPAIDTIVTSPYARAKDTAEIVAQHLNLQDKVVCDERLAPGFDRLRLGRLLKNYPEAGGLMLVGHEPDFTGTLEQIIGGRVILKKGGIAYVQAGDPPLKKASYLGWLVQPSILET